jgi:hypothetical protein
MSDEIYFDDSSLSIVDNWMSPIDEKSSNNNENKSIKKINNNNNNNVNAINKGGLGFKSSKKQIENDVLSDRLKKQDRIKQKNDKLNNNKDKNHNNDDDLHGIIEDFSESKSSIVLKSKPIKKINYLDNKIQNSKNISKINKFNNDKKKENEITDNKNNKNINNNDNKKNYNSNSYVINDNNKRPIIEENNTNINVTETKTSNNDVDNVNKDNSEDVNNISKNKVEKRKFGFGFNSQETKSQAAERKEGKRHKTRSKQKNIRRDNRPDKAKPDNLKFGNEGYIGRVLTAETKKILAIEEKIKGVNPRLIIKDAVIDGSCSINKKNGDKDSNKDSNKENYKKKKKNKNKNKGNEDVGTEITWSLTNK